MTIQSHSFGNGFFIAKLNAIHYNEAKEAPLVEGASKECVNFNNGGNTMVKRITSIVAVFVLSVTMIPSIAFDSGTT